MLNNLFSSFDTKNFFNLSFLIINIYLIIFISMFKKNNMMIFLLKKFFLFLFININKMIFFMSVFMMIFLLNFMSLNYYSFNMTSQMSYNMMMIFVLWVPMLIISMTKFNNSFLIHLLPMGIKGLLIPMMILIEFLSFMIRPLTLFLRLSINMIAGHVLMSLLSLMIFNYSLIFLLVMYLYMIMKFLVSFIQSYIIIILLNLYMEEMYVK